MGGECKMGLYKIAPEVVLVENAALRKRYEVAQAKCARYYGRRYKVLEIALKVGLTLMIVGFSGMLIKLVIAWHLP